jgi:rRNA-processing protein FCF1
VRVILDSNFLMIPIQFHIDIFRELDELLNQKVETVIPSPVYEEIQRIACGKSKLAKEAKLALKIAEKSEVLEVKLGPGESTDDLIARLAREWGCLVATNDRELRRKLRGLTVPVIYLRQKSRLAIEGL